MMPEAERIKALKRAHAQIIELSNGIDMNPPDLPRLRTASLPTGWTNLKPQESEKHLIRLHALIHRLREEETPTDAHHLPQWTAGSFKATYGQNSDAYQMARNAHEKEFPAKKDGAKRPAKLQIMESEP